MNDLTSMVVKKTPLVPVPVPAPETSGAVEKCNAEGGETETAPPDKKARLEEALGHDT